MRRVLSSTDSESTPTTLTAEFLCHLPKASAVMIQGIKSTNFIMERSESNKNELGKEWNGRRDGKCARLWDNQIANYGGGGRHLSQKSPLGIAVEHVSCRPS